VASVATLAGIAIGRVAVQALHAQAKPRAYVVIEIDVVNQDAFFKEFVPVAVKTIMDQGGKFLARGGALVNIEGPGPLYSEVKRLTVVEFENMKKHRQRLLRRLTAMLERLAINMRSSASLAPKVRHNNHPRPSACSRKA